MNSPGPSWRLYGDRDVASDDCPMKSEERKRKAITGNSDDSDVQCQDNVNEHYDEFDHDNSETIFEETDTESDDDLENDEQLLHELFESNDGGDEPSRDNDLKKFPYDGNTVMHGLPNGPSPYDFFELLLDYYFFATIVTETNRNAAVQTNGQWKELTVAEFKKFLALLLHTGTVKCTRLQNYWSVDRLFGFQCFSQHISRNRFRDILRYLHFSSVNRSNDPLCKIQPIINYFNDKMRIVYYPERELSVNKVFAAKRDGSPYIRGEEEKDHRYSVKLYTLTDGSGVAVGIEASTGNADASHGRGHVTRMVVRLLQDYLHKGHSVFVDDYCASFALCKQLLEADTYSTGVLRRLGKGNGGDSAKTKWTKGEVMSRRRNNVTIGRFMDRGEVYFVSSEFTADLVELANTKGGKRKRPLALHKYHEFARNLKKRDRTLSCYTCCRKTYKWYVQLWINATELLLLNSFVLYTKYSSLAAKLNFYDYRLNVIDALLYENDREIVQFDVRGFEHLPEMLPRGINNKVRRKKCRQCFASCLRKETNYFCSGCKDSPGLCLGKCFREYHQRILRPKHDYVVNTRNDEPQRCRVFVSVKEEGYSFDSSQTSTTESNN